MVTKFFAHTTSVHVDLTNEIVSHTSLAITHILTCSCSWNFIVCYTSSGVFAIQVEFSQCTGTSLHVLYFLYASSVTLTVLSLLYKVMFCHCVYTSVCMCACKYASGDLLYTWWDDSVTIYCGHRKPVVSLVCSIVIILIITVTWMHNSVIKLIWRKSYYNQPSLNNSEDTI